MTFNEVFKRAQDSFISARSGVARLPLQARSLLYLVGVGVLLITLIALFNILGWWLSNASEINSTKPSVSRLLGYIEASPQIDVTLARVNEALSQVAIEDTGDTGRGGALLQQQLRQLAAEAGLTVVGSEVKEPETLDALVKLKATLQVTGGPEDLDEFFQRLYRSSPALFPESMRIEALRRQNRRLDPSRVEGTEDHVSGRIDVSAYRLSAANE